MKINVLVLTLLLAGGASAQTVYRCGPEGRSYSHQPCADGRAVGVGDARPDAERRDGEAAASRQMRLARTMERDRLDAPAATMRAVRLDSRPAPQAEHSKASMPAKDFRAVDGPTKKRAKRRAA